MSLKGYKVFLPDLTAKQGGFQYKENETFEVSLPIRICSHGLHFCLKASDCFSYYDFDPKNIVCEVEAFGETQSHDEDSKICTNKLHVGRRLEWHEVLSVTNVGVANTGHSNSGNCNSGHRNSGDSNSGDSNSGNWNSGNRNSGNRNSGDWNSGNWNSGDSNSGNWNSGDSNSGCSNSGNWNSGHRNSGDSNSGYRAGGAFCTEKNPKLILFDKLTDIDVKDWEQSEAVSIMSRLLDFTIWVPSNAMTNDEKEIHPKHETTDGYLKTKTVHEAWADMWGNLKAKEKKVFSSLQNFDADKFLEITGIKL